MLAPRWGAISNCVQSIWRRHLLRNVTVTPTEDQANGPVPNQLVSKPLFFWFSVSTSSYGYLTWFSCGVLLFILLRQTNKSFRHPVLVDIIQLFIFDAIANILIRKTGSQLISFKIQIYRYFSCFLWLSKSSAALWICWNNKKKSLRIKNVIFLLILISNGAHLVEE